MSLSTWVLIALLIYLLVILVIGIVSGRGAGEDDEKLFVADRGLTGLQDGLSVFATAINAAALTGTVGLFYTGGASMLGYAIAYVMVAPVLYWLVGSRLRRIGHKYKYQTQADFLKHFFNSKYLGGAATVAGIIFLTPYFAVSPIAMGITLHYFMGIPYWVGVVAFLVTTVAYTFYGGLKAIAQTDVFHGILLVLFFVMLVPILIHGAGGFSSIFALPKASVATSGGGLLTFLTWVIYIGLTPIVTPDRALRMFSVKDTANMRKSALYMGVTLGISGLSFLIIGLACMVIIPGVTGNETQTILQSVLSNVAPWMLPFLVISIWGGGMSALSVGLLTTANVFTKDIYSPYLSKKGGSSKNGKKIVGAGRIVTIILTVFTAWISLSQPPFVWFFINLTLGLFLQFIPAFIGGLYWKGSTKIATEISWTVGVILVLVWTFFVKLPTGITAGFAALVVNVVLFVVISLASRNLDQHKAHRLQLMNEASKDEPISQEPVKPENAKPLVV